MSGRRSKSCDTELEVSIDTELDQRIAQFEAEWAATRSARNPNPKTLKRMLQAARDRAKAQAKAEQRKQDLRERDRLRQLLGLKGKAGRTKLALSPKQQSKRLLRAENLINEIHSLKQGTLAQAFRDYAQAHGGKWKSVERRYRRYRAAVKIVTP